MRYCVLILLLFISLPVAAQNASAQQAAAQPQGPFVSNITIQGFVLEENKDQFVKLFRPYRNKHLSAVQVDTILQALQEIYEEAGYQGLISIEYRLVKKNLVFTVSLIK